LIKDKKDLHSGAESGILNKGGEVGTKKGILFMGAEARAEDTAFIEKSDAPATFVNQVKIAEATATYVEDKTLKSAGLYRTTEDVIRFNTEHPAFSGELERRVRLRWHEVLHRGDTKYYRSWKDEGFGSAIDNAKTLVDSVVDKVLEETKELTREDIVGVHDILSALRQGKNEGLISYHDAVYWASNKKHTPMEIFANLGTLDLMKGKGLSVVKKYFPDIFNAYREMIR
jgi:hypothetical protein